MPSVLICVSLSLAKVLVFSLQLLLKDWTQVDSLQQRLKSSSLDIVGGLCRVEVGENLQILGSLLILSRIISGDLPHLFIEVNVVGLVKQTPLLVELLLRGDGDGDCGTVGYRNLGKKIFEMCQQITI